MAARGSGSTALVITTIIFAMVTIAGFVVSIIQFSKATEVQRAYDTLQQDYSDIVLPSELSAPRVEAAKSAAGRRSAVDFLLTENAELKTIIGGSGDVALEQLKTRVAERTGGAQGALLGQLKSANDEVDRLREQVRAERQRAQTAIANAEAEASRVSQIRAGFDQTVAQERSRVGAIESAVDEYDSEIQSATQGFSSERDEIRSSYERQISTRDDQIADLNQTVLVLRDQLTRLRGEGVGGGVRPPDEFALADGEILQIVPLDNEVIIDVGARQKLQIGQIFSVYSFASELRPDPQTGEYAQGKAAIEVIRINPNTARARIVRSSAGNPIVSGDIIASPVFDPNKTYRFVVFGSFDVNRDGVSSALERGDVANIIERWGGILQDDIAGDTDFLVLGSRPELPVAPGPSEPREVVLEYVRLRAEIDRYDQLLRQAESTSLPVLNENRLRTLIGDFPD